MVACQECKRCFCQCSRLSKNAKWLPFLFRVYVFPRGSKYHSEGQLLAAEEVIVDEDLGFTGSNEM